MKITKIITPILLATATVVPTIALSSCHKTDEGGGGGGGEPTKTVQSAQEYIYDRTFSLYAYGTDLQYQYSCYGTAWVLSDATPDDSTDYKYYIATNWHVQKSIDNIKAKSSVLYQISYGCGTGSTIDPSTFLNFTSYDKVDDVKSSYDGSTTITTKEGDVTKTGLKGCDIHVIKADFASCKSSQTSVGVKTKEKLDRLNQLTAKHEKITQLADATTDSNHFESKKLYTGGYPALTGCKWEFHNLNIDEGEGKVNLTYLPKEQETHWCDETNTPLTDCTPQYHYTGSTYFKNWMAAGASGSMLIGNFGTTDDPVWKVIAIYWGGIGTKVSETLYYTKPCFSIFNSNWKNYLSEW